MDADEAESPPRDTVTEIQFGVSDPAYPLVTLAAETDGRVDVLETVQSAPHTVEFLRVDTERPGDVLDAASACDRTRDVEPLDRRGDELLVELVVADSMLRALADAGAIVRDAYAEDAEARATVYLSPTRSPGPVVSAVQDAHPSLRVVSITDQPVAEPLLTRQGFGARLRERLTDRQWEALRVAHEEGYFERPRDVSQATLAEEMDIGQETVSQHLRAAQRHLLSLVFDDGLVDPSVGNGS